MIDDTAKALLAGVALNASGWCLTGSLPSELSQLSHIEQQSQTFRARVYVSFCIEGGALDEDLSKQFDGFPVDEDGRPTNRPSAVWYLSQLQFHNGHDLRVLESKVAVVGNDLHLVQRLEGEFFERFEIDSDLRGGACGCSDDPGACTGDSCQIS